MNRQEKILKGLAEIKEGLEYHMGEMMKQVGQTKDSMIALMQEMHDSGMSEGDIKAMKAHMDKLKEIEDFITSIKAKKE